MLKRSEILLFLCMMLVFSILVMPTHVSAGYDDDYYNDDALYDLGSGVGNGSVEKQCEVAPEQRRKEEEKLQFYRSLVIVENLTTEPIEVEWSAVSPYSSIDHSKWWIQRKVSIAPNQCEAHRYWWPSIKKAVTIISKDPEKTVSVRRGQVIEWSGQTRCIGYDQAVAERTVLGK